MSSEKKYFARFDERLEKISQAIKNQKAPWKKRYDALVDLESLVHEGVEYGDSFVKRLSPSQVQLADGLGAQISDLRSELVRQASKVITLVATDIGNSFKKWARKIMPVLIETSAARNGTIRTYAAKCVFPVLQNCHSKNVLYTVLDELNSTKNKMIQENTLDFLRTILAFWPVNAELTRHADVIQEAIVFGLSCATTKARDLAVKCFWLYAGHFNDKRDPFLESLDARMRRIVERGKTEEEEQEEHQAATKIGAVMKGALQRRRFRKSISLGETLDVGDRVVVRGQKGTIKYKGEIPGKEGSWVGVTTDEPAEGNGDGCFEGVQVWDAEPGCGAIARLTELQAENAMNKLPKDAFGVDAEDDGKHHLRAHGDGGDDDDDDDDDDASEMSMQTPRFTAKSPADSDHGTAETKTKAAAPTMGRAKSAPEPPKKMDPLRLQADLSKARERRLTETPLVSLADSQKKATSKPSTLTVPEETSKDMPESPRFPGSSPEEEDEKTLTMEDLYNGHKEHLKTMGETFSSLMDLYDTAHVNPKYLSDMTLVLSQLVGNSAKIQTLFSTYANQQKSSAGAAAPVEDPPFF